MLLQFGDGMATAVAHTGAQAAYQLIAKIGKRPFIRNAAFDAFRDEFATSWFARNAQKCLRDWRPWNPCRDSS